MQSITKFFSPKKNDDASDFAAAKNTRKSNKNSKDSLLKIVDNEVEDITGLLFETLNGDHTNKLEQADEITQPSKSEEGDQNCTSSSTEQIEVKTEPSSNVIEPKNLEDKSPISNRTRRFSFNIKSPLRTPQKNSSLSRSKKDPLDSSFDEALAITVNNSWTDSKEDADVEVIHPKKRLKVGSSGSEAQSPNSHSV